MTPITVNSYKTPTAANGECPWSVGIMNLTKAEVDLVAEFARNVRGVVPWTRTKDTTAADDSGSTADRLRRFRPSAEKLREIWLSEDNTKPELAEPGNRFSGLDIPETDK